MSRDDSDDVVDVVTGLQVIEVEEMIHNSTNALLVYIKERKEPLVFL